MKPVFSAKPAPVNVFYDDYDAKIFRYFGRKYQVPKTIVGLKVMVSDFGD